jgi:hypothetical protein
MLFLQSSIFRILPGYTNPVESVRILRRQAEKDRIAAWYELMMGDEVVIRITDI